MPSQTKVDDSLIGMVGDRTFEAKMSDIMSAFDYGASKTGTATANTIAINAAILAASYASGYVLVAPGVSFNESGLSFINNVTLLVFGQYGTVTFLTKNQGDSPIARGGIVVKAQGHTGILLRAVDHAVSGEPLLQLVDFTTGDVGGAQLGMVELPEITAPAAPAANYARLYVRDNGAGKTQLVIQFATGTVMPLATQSAEASLTGSATYDPGSLSDGAGATTTVTVTGAVLGDFAAASFNKDLQGIILSAWVSGTDTVSVRFQNETGGTLDLVSGTLAVRVLRDY